MDDPVRRSLAHGQVIDITTTGRRTGEPRRIEIVDHVIDGRIYISGMPRPDRVRAWIHNLDADPRLTIHLKAPVSADVPATARVVRDPVERRRVFEWITQHAWRNLDVDRMLVGSPLIEVTPQDESAG
jgi:deazaflavin-dependent oxidoreductase (nitroreductase family)